MTEFLWLLSGVKQSMKLNYVLILISLLVSCNHVKQPSNLNDRRINNLINGLYSSEWETVCKSKDTLEQLEKEAIPYLIENLNSKIKHTKLESTTDLIYPGATEFYGSGWIVDYDIDWLNIRTGWAIEEITFNNFGFKECKITEDAYLQNGKSAYKISPDGINKLNELISKTNDWWAKNSNTWNRLIGITEALKSDDYQRQSNALQYLRHGNYCINGLTKEYFDKELRPIVNKLLLSSEDYIKEDAKLLIDIVDYSGEMIFDNITTKCWNKASAKN